MHGSLNSVVSLYVFCAFINSVNSYCIVVMVPLVSVEQGGSQEFHKEGANTKKDD